MLRSVKYIKRLAISQIKLSTAPGPGVRPGELEGGKGSVAPSEPASIRQVSSSFHPWALKSMSFKAKIRGSLLNS